MVTRYVKNSRRVATYRNQIEQAAGLCLLESIGDQRFPGEVADVLVLDTLGTTPRADRADATHRAIQV